MKTPFLLNRSLIAAAGLLAAAGTVTADFGVSLRSTELSNTDTLADRLYAVLSAGPASGNRLPGGTTFWFVFDTAGDGVPAQSAPAGSTFDTTSILGSDDVKFETTLTSAGRIARSITPIPDSLRLSSDPLSPDYLLSKPAYGLLFNVPPSGLPVAVGDPDASFGVWSFGELSVPSSGVGNAPARIDSPTYADTHKYTAVPEPGTLSLLVLGVIMMLGRAPRRV